MFSLLLLPSLAAAGWTQTASSNGCTFLAGDPVGDTTPLRGECDWAIAPEKLHQLLAAFGAHDDYFSAVAESTVKGATTGGTLVHQVHVASGIADRECYLVFSTTDLPGGKRYAWTKAVDQAGLTRVVPAQDDGKWEVTSGQNGGSHVVYELAYNPGGSVPGFIVRWFQGSGFQLLVGELKTWAEAHP